MEGLFLLRLYVAGLRNSFFQGMEKQNLHMCRELRYLISSAETNAKKFAARFSECKFWLSVGYIKKDLFFLI